MTSYPFSPAILDALPEGLVELFRDLENTLLKEICSRLNLSGQLNEVTVQAIRALRSHGISLDEIKEAIASTSQVSMGTLNTLLDDVVARNQAYYTEMITLADVTAPEIMVNTADIEAIRQQTQDTFKNLTQSMGFLVDNGRTMLTPAKAYQWALDRAEMQVQSGTISYNQAIENAVKQLADSGLCVLYDRGGRLVKNMVVYESGHRDQLDVAVRRAVMTGINQINQEYREQSMDYLETDLVEVTAHMGARNIDGPKGWENHERWQGGVYRWSEKPRNSEGDYPDFEKTCGYGSVTGIGGANCRHSFWAFIEGVMERTYTDKQLDAMKAENHKFTYQGKTYDGYSATQKQRQIERTIRAIKREKNAFEASGQTDGAQAAAVKLRRLNQQYRDFSKAAGLPEQIERLKVLYT